MAESDFHLCGAVENFNGKFPLRNNIIRDNYSNHYSGIQVVESKDFYTQNNNIQGYDGNDTNQDLDPWFLMDGAHPYQLTDGSPCMESGAGNFWEGALAHLDLAGRERICGESIDMGAYEYCGGLSLVPQEVPEMEKPALSCLPNPFNPRTRIQFDLPGNCSVDLQVYDLRGRMLKSLVKGQFSAGHHEIDWNGCDNTGRSLSSGTYLYRLRAGDDVVTRSVTLIR